MEHKYIFIIVISNINFENFEIKIQILKSVIC